MGFHDVQFPPQIAAGATGGPREKILIAETASGREKRNIEWSTPRLVYNVGTGLRTNTDMLTLLAFWRVRRGPAYAFRFKDWLDYQLPRQQIGTTNGATATCQIYKRYTSGGFTHDRAIMLPVSGTVRCWVGGTERTIGAGGSQFQVALTTGIVTLGATLAATTGQAIEVQCDFDVPCRFDAQDVAALLRDADINEIPDIRVIEVRL